MLSVNQKRDSEFNEYNNLFYYVLKRSENRCNKFKGKTFSCINLAT